MKFLVALLLFLSTNVLAQDTIRVNVRDLVGEGKYKAYKYVSATTGVKQKAKYKIGLWQYFDEFGALQKAETYITSGNTSYVDGDQIFYNEYQEPVLIRTYKHQKVVNEKPLLACILILQKDTITIKQMGDSAYIYKPIPRDLTWLNYANIVKINTIEDPNAEYKLAMYQHFEDSIGNPDLLVNSTFSIHHPLNAVANPGFEDHPTLELSKTSFSDEITAWAPASVSPDFFITPTAAKEGVAFVGIRVYSPTKDIEYIENKLNYRLAKGQKYCFTTYVKLGPSCTIATDAFGVHFSANAISFADLDKTDIKPQLSLDKEFLTYKSKWMVLQCSYVANGTENWMTLGTFKPLQAIKKLPIYGYANESYYYVDNVSLIPIESDNECPCNFKGDRDVAISTIITNQEQDLEAEFINLEVGERIVLENIYFDNDKYELLPKSEQTLTKLHQLLLKYPALKIEISGHTSSIGGYEHNITLSKNRANVVVAYLVEKGIEASRLVSAGYGPDLPIAPNDTEANMQINRRVELKILAK